MVSNTTLTIIWSPKVFCDVVHRPNLDGREVAVAVFSRFEFQHGQVGFRVASDRFGSEGFSIVERDFDLVGAFNHVMVGQDVTIGADDDS